jgi:hypothetical protein
VINLETDQNLIALSERLLVNLEFAHQRFQHSKEKRVRGDFHEEVKPFADEVKGTTDTWRKAASYWVGQNRPKNLHVNQIETAADYLEVISVQAFFPETSKKRFLDQIQSVEFILKSLIIAVNQTGSQK